MLHRTNAALQQIYFPPEGLNMTKDNIETLKNLGDTGYQQARELSELNLRTWSEMAEQQMNLFGLMLNTGMRQTELMTQAQQDPSRLLDEQMKLSRELGEALVERNHELLSRSSEIGNSYRELFENGARRTAETLKPDTSSAAA